MMEIGCSNLKEYVAKFSLVSSCDVIKNGSLRFATPFTYPDGSHIDLFLQSKRPLVDEFIISDYGHTFTYLDNIGFNIWKTKARRQLVTDICTSLGVAYLNNSFVVPIIKEDLVNLSDIIVRLSQACIRITDMSFTQRTYSFDSFESDVEEAIAATDLKYDTDVAFTGRWKAPVKVNFMVEGKSVSSLIQTLSFKDQFAGHQLSNELYVKWQALQSIGPKFQFITVLDENAPLHREDDIARLYEVSTPLSFPSQRDQLLETIAA